MMPYNMSMKFDVGTISIKYKEILLFYIKCDNGEYSFKQFRGTDTDYILDLDDNERLKIIGVDELV